MQGKGLVVHSFSLSLFGECYSYSIPLFLTDFTDLSGYNFMIITLLCNFYPFMTALIKQINPTIKAKIAILPGTRSTPLTYLYIKLLFVELIKIVIMSIRIYKDIPQGKLVVTFRNFTCSRV